MKLSFCAIVKNEARNLDRCLVSVKPYVSELIMVDTGSTDTTISIAQQHGARISAFEWCNDFAAARNYAKSLATGDWILTLDADEELVSLTDDWMETLQKLAERDILAFAIKLRDVVALETSMDAIRLFRNLPEMQYQEAYHEYLAYAGQPLSLRGDSIQPLQGIEIVHYGYAPEVIVEKSALRIPMLEHLRQKEDLSLMLLWSLSGMYEATQRLEQAQNCYWEAWERLLPHLLSGEMPEDTRSVPSWLYSIAVRSLEEDVETSQLICERGMEWFPDFPPLFYLNGLILKTMGAAAESISYFEHCLHAGQTHNYSKAEPFDQALITVYPACDLGTVYLELKEPQKAIAAFELALSFDPNYGPAQEQLAIAQAQL